ncbi:hypothetical protein LOD99_10712 [Oopsacas minuta]|uniref:Uncharacterized protein n=1 Tax=Oopsacas minuta TaxID=111878 RepID=A0AAV7KEF0_9METZ|nr:hypothetical protein LOD99_10712 [Oopsacas minuta]
MESLDTQSLEGAVGELTATSKKVEVLTVESKGIEHEYQCDANNQSYSAIPSPPLSEFPTQPDEYEDQILTTLPFETIISDNLVSIPSNITSPLPLLTSLPSKTRFQMIYFHPSTNQGLLVLNSLHLNLINAIRYQLEMVLLMEEKLLAHVLVHAVLVSPTLYMGGLREKKATEAV